MRTEITQTNLQPKGISIEPVGNVQPHPVADLSVILAKTRIRSFPTTRYYGSKKRLLHWIYEHLKEVPFKSVLDGFGGTGIVSLLFKAMGKHVTFNDALLSNTISAQALLANNLPFEGVDEVKAFFNEISPVKGFITQTFNGKFYLDNENAWLDGAVTAISNLDENKRVALLYSLFQACLQKRPFNLFHRANLNLRTAQSHNQRFGNQTTWDTPFPTLATRAYSELTNSFWQTSVDHTVLAPIDVSEIPSGYDLVYFDPPYIGKSNGDDYLRRYHFLEGLSQYDQWPELIDEKYNNLQFIKKNHISDWQNRRVFKDKLFSLIERHKQSIVALSYVDNAYPSRDELSTYFKQVFKNHEIIEKELPHALSHGKKVELLIIGFPR